MATRRPAFAVPVAELAASLLAQPEVGPRARVIAEQVAQFLADTAVVVYVIADQANPTWTSKATSGDITVPGSAMEFEAGTLGAVAENKTLMVFESGDLQREQYGHLDVRRTVRSLAYVPLLMDETLIGAIEVISYEQPFPESMLEAVQEIAELGAPAIAAALSYESERNISLHSISRVTQMYDLEKVFNSTLEMDELLETIAKKFQEVMNAQGVNLWMVNDDAIELMNCAGVDATIEVGAVQNPGEGCRGRSSPTAAKRC